MLNLTANDTTSLSLQCSYTAGGSIQFHHEFSEKVIDILEVGQPADDEK